jgi:hypothetical protein
MNDCPNAEIRDRLPDLLHDRLDVSMRAAVMAHVDDCVDCRAELELLKGVRGVMVAQTPRVDINYVVNALPKQYAKATRVAPRRRTWADWRVAAAVTVLAVGGGSLAVMNSDRSGAVPVTRDTSRLIGQSANLPPVATPSSGTSQSAESPRQVVASADEGSGSTALAAAGLSDLSERELQGLLDDIDRLQAVPIADPQPITIRVESSSPEGA